MSKPVGRHVLRDSRPADRRLHRALNECVIDVMPALFAGLPVAPPAPLWEHELPPPFRSSTRVLALQSIRHDYSSVAFRQIAIMCLLDRGQVLSLQHLPIEEQQRTQSLGLGRRAHVLPDGQVRVPPGGPATPAPLERVYLRLRLLTRSRPILVSQGTSRVSLRSDALSSPSIGRRHTRSDLAHSQS